MVESAEPATSPMLRFLELAAADPGLSQGPTDVSQRAAEYLVDGYFDRGLDDDATGAP